MKKTLLFAAIIAGVFAFTGCEKKDNKNDSNKAPIVGSWKYDGLDYTYTFNEDGTCSYVGYGNLMECTYTTDGDNISILYKGNTAPFETKFYIDGDALNIVDSFDEPTYYKKQK